jgi:hypothetical protein
MVSLLLRTYALLEDPLLQLEMDGGKTELTGILQLALWHSGICSGFERRCGVRLLCSSVVSPSFSFAGDNGTCYDAADNDDEDDDANYDIFCSDRRGHFWARPP